MVKKIISLFIVTRIALFFFPWILRYLHSEPLIYESFFHYLSNSWSFWDAPHFLYIAKNWYSSVGDPANFIVFLPLYPLLVAGILPIFKNPEIAGIVVSFSCSVLMVAIFYKLNTQFNNSKVSFRSTFFLTIFPTSFFLIAPYTESLYLLLWSLSFLASFKKKWIIAGFTAGLASFTRNFGILVLPAILVQWYLTKGNKRIRDVLYLTVPTLVAVGIYLLINNLIYDDPFAFQKILSNHWQKVISFPVYNFINVWKIAFSIPVSHYSLTVGWSEGLALLLVLLLTPYIYKKLPLSLFVYHLLSLILISSTSFILSTPRYILSIPTVFIVLGKLINNSVSLKIYEFVSIGLLFYLTYIYTVGQWTF